MLLCCWKNGSCACSLRLLLDFYTQPRASVSLLKLSRWNTINANREGVFCWIPDSGTTVVRGLIIKDMVGEKNGEEAFALVGSRADDTQLCRLGGLTSTGFQGGVLVFFQEQLVEAEADCDVVLPECPLNTLRALENGIFVGNLHTRQSRCFEPRRLYVVA